MRSAGWASRWPATARSGRDHSRIRGKHTPPKPSDPSEVGPSPRTRGAREQRHAEPLVGGTIPAFAGSAARTSRCRRRGRDHLRIRGEHRSLHRPGGGFFRPSPHTRGAPGTEATRDAPGGTIPAYAGSTACDSGRVSASRDHHRIRGEHCHACARRSRAVGPSPHTRGARSIRSHTSDQSRTIPAYAGSAGAGTAVSRSLRDHPRIRGEHAALHGRREGRLGTIPAYAGSTGNPEQGSVIRQDHPRIRGEHAVSISCPMLPSGPSPHTRGAPQAARRGEDGPGTIPAYAGSTPGGPTSAAAARDHPRIRGEHRSRYSQVLLLHRTIPAYAGSTSTPVSAPSGTGDHPRIRGEHTHHPPPASGVEGPSPHTRGAPEVGLALVAVLGTIPAYAGSTGGTTLGRTLTGDHPRIRGEHTC